MDGARDGDRPCPDVLAMADSEVENRTSLKVARIENTSPEGYGEQPRSAVVEEFTNLAVGVPPIAAAISLRPPDFLADAQERYDTPHTGRLIPPY
jgi:hypothetical protein